MKKGQWNAKHAHTVTEHYASGPQNHLAAQREAKITPRKLHSTKETCMKEAKKEKLRKVSTDSFVVVDGFADDG